MCVTDLLLSPADTWRNLPGSHSVAASLDFGTAHTSRVSHPLGRE